MKIQMNLLNAYKMKNNKIQFMSHFEKLFYINE